MSASLLLEQLAELIATPADVALLNQAILELAVRGALTSREPHDEPVSELLKQIKTNADNIVEDGKRRKIELLSPVKNEEKTFDLPNNWKWVRVGDVAYGYRGHNPPKDEFVYEPQEGYVRFVQITDFKTEERAVYVPISPQNKMVYKGEIIMAAYRHIGKLSREMEGAFNVALCKVMELPPMSRDYLEKIIGTSFVKGELLKASARAHIPSMHLEHFLSLPIPLPPLAEQARIVAKVEELFAQTRALADKLAQCERSLSYLNQAALHYLLAPATPDELKGHWAFMATHFDTLFTHPDHVAPLRQAILELAVRGALTQREATDEPASELLRRIREEKAAQGKVKPLPPISDEEKPFELPIGWEWVRFEELGELERGRSRHRPRNAPFLYENGKYPFVQTGDVSQSKGRITAYSTMYSEEGLAQSRMWPKGTLCITIAANIAETGILEFDSCFPDSIVGFIPSVLIGEPDYFQYFIKVAKERLESYAPATAQKNINLGILQKLLIPLPPTNEIKRIVAKVEALMGGCDELEAKLRHAQAQRARLTAAVLAGV